LVFQSQFPLVNVLSDDTTPILKVQAKEKRLIA